MKTITCFCGKCRKCRQRDCMRRGRVKREDDWKKLLREYEIKKSLIDHGAYGLGSTLNPKLFSTFL